MDAIRLRRNHPLSSQHLSLSILSDQTPEVLLPGQGLPDKNMCLLKHKIAMPARWRARLSKTMVSLLCGGAVVEILRVDSVELGPPTASTSEP